MKRFISFIIMVTMLLIANTAMADRPDRKKRFANQDTEDFRYEIEYARAVGDGAVQVKVWSFSRRQSVAEEQCKKNAVHGIIFKGAMGGDSNATVAPLARTPEIGIQKEPFFKEFFADHGPYMRYVSNAVEGTREKRKVGKQFKIGVVVTVNRSMLRKHLEQHGVITGMASMF